MNLGTRLLPAVEAARLLETTRTDVSVTVADARFMKPLDIDLLRSLAADNEVLVTLEEGSVGGKSDSSPGSIFLKILYRQF